MIINLEIIDCKKVYDKEEIIDLKTKEIVPKMVTRRRLTRASKIALFLVNDIDIKNKRVIFGSAYGELLATANILNNINDKEPISPTYFQNSVYNTAVSYLSMLSKNQEEFTTISSGDKTSLNVLKAGAIKALDGDEIVLLAIETLNIPNISEVNKCIDYLECGVVLKVKATKKEPNIKFEELSSQVDGFSNSLSHILNLVQIAQNDNRNIVEIKI